MALPLLILIALAASATPAAAQQRLGTNLATHTPNASFDCTATPSAVGLLPSGVTNCTYLSTVFGAQSTAAPFPGGVITRVRVKAAAPTGPMRVVVARQIGTTTSGIGCCFYAGESQTFTPRANTTTAVRVRLPVENSIDPVNGVRVVDYLALSVLAPGVAIPGQIPGNGQLDGSLAFFPRLSRADGPSGRVDGYGNSLVPLLNADFTPLCGGASGAAGVSGIPRGRTARGELRFPDPRATAAAGRCLGGASARNGSLSRKRAKVPLDCNLSSRCAGKLKLRSKRGGGKLGDSKFKIRSGARKRVNVKLSKAGKRAAKRKRKLTVKARIRVAGGPNDKDKIKLKR